MLQNISDHYFDKQDLKAESYIFASKTAVLKNLLCGPDLTDTDFAHRVNFTNILCTAFTLADDLQA